MSKRFTDSDKWQDKWFRKLPPDQKLAYLYILDRCDMAGTIEIDTELAEFQMGCSTDWEGLVKGSGTRLVPLANGRLWVRKFISYQNGKLSSDCNAHKPIIRLVEKYRLPTDCVTDSAPNENKEKPTKGSGRVQVPLAKGPGNSNSNGNGNGNTKGECEGENQLTEHTYFEDQEFVELFNAFTRQSQSTHNWFPASEVKLAWLYELTRQTIDDAKAILRFSAVKGAKSPILNGDHNQKTSTGKRSKVSFDEGLLT